MNPFHALPQVSDITPSRNSETNWQGVNLHQRRKAIGGKESKKMLFVRPDSDFVHPSPSHGADVGPNVNWKGKMKTSPEKQPLRACNLYSLKTRRSQHKRNCLSEKTLDERRGQ